jgi:2'-5' RNA ligase
VSVLTASLHRAALRLRRRTPGAGAAQGSALVVPVPAAAEATGAWSGDAEALRPAGMPYHVTVLYPFVRADLIDSEVDGALREVAAACPPFTFTLAEVDRFDEVLFIAPRPPDRFVALTRQIHARWPQHPPYGGEFEQIVPHLTLSIGTEPPGLADSVRARLPIAARADELWLLVPAGGGAWSLRSRFPLGPAGR